MKDIDPAMILVGGLYPVLHSQFEGQLPVPRFLSDERIRAMLNDEVAAIVINGLGLDLSAPSLVLLQKAYSTGKRRDAA